MNRKFFIRVLVSGSGLFFFLLTLACQGPFHAAGKMHAVQRMELQRIAWMIWDEKPEVQILGVWERFVEREKKNNLDFENAIESIFEEVKIIANTNIRFAEDKIRQAQTMKAAIDQEMAHIRDLRIQYEKSGRIKSFKPKVFDATTELLQGTNIRIDVEITNIDVLDAYEEYVQWQGMEANLQGTGGVALLEYAKDAIQTAVSNISGVGAAANKMRKIVERKMGA